MESAVPTRTVGRGCTCRRKRVPRAMRQTRTGVNVSENCYNPVCALCRRVQIIAVFSNIELGWSPSGGSGGGAPPTVACHPGVASLFHSAGAHSVDRCTDRSGAPVGAAPGARTGAWMGGVEVAVTPAPQRMAGTLAVAWRVDHAEPWAPLVERPAAQGDVAGSALCRWNDAGFRQSTSLGWDGQRGQLTNPDAVTWQELVMATVTQWTGDVGTRIDDAEQQGGHLVACGGRRRQPARRHEGTACSGGGCSIGAGC